MYERPRSKFPCESYFGNVCSGFGGSLTCHGCGWDRYEHGQLRETMLSEFIEKEYPKYKFEQLKTNHPDVDFTIVYNDYYDWWEVRFEGLKFEIMYYTDDIEEMFKLCCIHEWGKK